MARAASARRYAQAVFQLALERDELEDWLADLTVLAQSLGTQEFAEFLDAPQVNSGKKLDTIKETLGNAVGPLALNLISILATRSITGILPDIVDQYQTLLDGQKGIERAEIVSAIALDDQQQNRIGELLEKIAGKEVQLTSRVDPTVLGGFVARVGDRVVDATGRTKLERLRQEFDQGG